MQIKGLDVLFLEVNSLEESLTFYKEVLGLELERFNPNAEPPIATLRAGSLRITLVQNLETMLRRGRGVHFILGVDDVEMFYDKLLRAGISIGEPKDEGWGGTFVTVEDPDKYRLFFVSWN